MFGKAFGCLAIAATLAMGAAQPTLAYDFPPSYTYSLPTTLDADRIGEASIYSILKYVRYPDSAPDSPGGSSWPNEISVGNSDIVEVFTQTQPITGAFFLGLIDQLVGEEPRETPHLVLFANPTVVQQGTDFATLFPGFEEAAIIGALQSAIAQNSNPTPEELDAAFAILDPFAVAAFNAGAYFTFDGGFNVVAFSTGVLIGTGGASVTAVPEPAALALLGLGLAGLATLRRRRA